MNPPTPDRNQPPTKEHTVNTVIDSTALDTTADPATVDATTDVATAEPPPSGGRVSTWSVIRGEWIKFWSVRSTKFTLLTAGLLIVVFGMIFSVVAESGEATGPAALLSDPLDLALGGMGLGEMIVGVLGVLIVAGEYSTGLIRTTFAAVGRRTRVLWAKTAVLAASVFAMAAVAVTAAVVAGQAVYAGDLPTVPLGDALDVIAGSVVYLVGMGLIGLALGFILRSTAAAIGTLVAGLFIGPGTVEPAAGEHHRRLHEVPAVGGGLCDDDPGGRPRPAQPWRRLRRVRRLGDRPARPGRVPPEEAGRLTCRRSPGSERIPAGSTWRSPPSPLLDRGVLVLARPRRFDAGWPEVAAGVGAFVLVALRRWQPFVLLASRWCGRRRTCWSGSGRRRWCSPCSCS
jgi:ABC-2 type transport system permease protein